MATATTAAICRTLAARGVHAIAEVELQVSAVLARGRRWGVHANPRA
jgi:hypothetical protein